MRCFAKTTYGLLCLSDFRLAFTPTDRMLVSEPHSPKTLPFPETVPPSRPQRTGPHVPRGPPPPPLPLHTPTSRRREFYHFDGNPFPFILKHLLKEEGVQQNDRTPPQHTHTH